MILRRVGRVVGANRPHLFCNINANRAPGNAASTPDTAGGAKLINPARQFMRHPLTITRTGRGPYTATGQVRKIHRETGVPPAPAFGSHTRQISDIFDGGTKARGTNHRAISTG